MTSRPSLPLTSTGVPRATATPGTLPPSAVQVRNGNFGGGDFYIGEFSFIEAVFRLLKVAHYDVVSITYYR